MPAAAGRLHLRRPRDVETGPGSHGASWVLHWRHGDCSRRASAASWARRTQTGSLRIEGLMHSASTQNCSATGLVPPHFSATPDSCGAAGAGAWGWVSVGGIAAVAGGEAWAPGTPAAVGLCAAGTGAGRGGLDLCSAWRARSAAAHALASRSMRSRSSGGVAGTAARLGPGSPAGGAASAAGGAAGAAARVPRGGLRWRVRWRRSRAPWR